MLIGLHKTLACSATIRMQPRVVLPHPGMLPSGSALPHQNAPDAHVSLSIGHKSSAA